MKKTLILGLVAVLMTFAGVQTASASYGYGGGSSGGSVSHSSGSSRIIVAPIVPVTPVTGKVLGASTFKFSSYLGQGASSDSVKQLQERLRTEGHFTFVTSTGYFGPITLAAVKSYQKAHGIIATGFVGPLTTAELNK